MSVDESRLLRHVAEALREAGLLEGRQPLLVAVSGGPDSLALLHLLLAVGRRYPLRLHVAHLNHGLRGAEAEGDALYVEQIASDTGLPFALESADVGEYRREHRLSWEAAAREVRYDFLSRTAESIGAAAVALGHTADDQAETVLMHLLRGTGLQGLRGMLTYTCWRNGQGNHGIALVRPLLKVTKEETQALCDARGLTPRHDSSNMDEHYARNRIRRDLLPRLAVYNPSIREALVRLAHTASRDLAYIDDQVRTAWPTVVTREPWGLRISRDAFLLLHPALQAHLLRRAWEELVGESAALSYAQVEAMLELTQEGGGDGLMKKGGEGFLKRGGAGLVKKVSLGRGVRFHTGYQELVMESAATPSDQGAPLGTTALSLPGKARIDGWRVTARLLDAPVTVAAAGPYLAYLDRTALGDGVQIRSQRNGDRFQPLGMEGTKRLKEFMIDAHVPRSWRERIPLLVVERGVAWVVGWRIAHWARVTEATRQVVEVVFSRVE